MTRFKPGDVVSYEGVPGLLGDVVEVEDPPDAEGEYQFVKVAWRATVTSEDSSDLVLEPAPCTGGDEMSADPVFRILRNVEKWGSWARVTADESAEVKGYVREHGPDDIVSQRIALVLPIEYEEVMSEVG